MSRMRVLAGLMVWLLGVAATTAAERPNVLFIVCDDLNNHVTTSGYKTIKTPAFDRLAAEGLRFNRAYCQYAYCGPSRASFLAGMYPESTGVLDNVSDIRKTRPDTAAMPKVFRDAGYWTARVGKIFHTARTNPAECWDANPERFGNDELPMVAAARTVWEAEHGPITPKNRKDWLRYTTTLGSQNWSVRNPSPEGLNRGHGPTGLLDEQHRDGKNRLAVIDHLQTKPYGEQPFFIAVGIHKPHIPFLAPDKYYDMYPLESLQFETPPADFWDQAPRSHVIMSNVTRYESKLSVENDAVRRKYMQAYHACISFVDAQIGMIFDALKETGQWENTIIVLTSDHGYQLGEHFLYGKATLYEEVPLIIRVPEGMKGATTPGSITEGLVELVDIFPTLADVCGVEIPADVQGMSLTPLCSDPLAAGKEVVYTVIARPPPRVDYLARSIRTKDWMYAQFEDGEEMYQLSKDPQQWNNLVHSVEHAAQVKIMRALLETTTARAQAKR